MLYLFDKSTQKMDAGRKKRIYAELNFDCAEAMRAIMQFTTSCASPLKILIFSSTST
jgi:hypothetical protein